MIRTRSVQPRLWLSACAVVVLWCAVNTSAQTTANWLYPVSGNWTDPTLWSSDPFFPSNGTPAGASYHALIDSVGAPYAVSLNGMEGEIDSLTIDSPDITFNASAGSLTIDVQGVANGTLTFARGQAVLAGAAVNVIGGASFTGGANISLSAGTFQSMATWVSNQSNFHQTGGTNTTTRGLRVAGGSAYCLAGGTINLGTQASIVGLDGHGQFIHTGGTCIQSSGPMIIGGLGAKSPGIGDFIVDGPNAVYRGTVTGPLNGTNLVGIGSNAVGHFAIRNGAVADLVNVQVGVNNGVGTFVVESAAQVTITRLWIGRGDWSYTSNPWNFNGFGTVILRGEDSRITLVPDFNFPEPGSAVVGSTSLAGSTNAGAGTLQLDGGTLSGTIFLRPGGVLIVSGGALEAPTLDVSGGSALFQSGRVNVGTLQILQNAVHLSNGADKTLRARALSIQSGKIDLADNRMIIDYSGGSPIHSIRFHIASGHAGGSWGGDGITSTSAATTPGHGLGYAEASAIFSSFPAVFGGYEVDQTSVLIRYTRYGDANLDGVVNLADFNRLAANFGSSGAVWSQGDFNYDSMVNLADFNLLAANFGLTAAGPEVTPQDWAALASAVPEPGAGLVLAGAALLATRRPTQCATPGKTGEARAAA